MALSGGGQISVSVVILTKDGVESIGECLSAVFSQEFNKNFEVICVDSGSLDGTPRVCLRYGVRFFQIKPECFNHGLTRNFAAGKARGEYLVFLSQDAVPNDRDWLSSLIRVMESDGEVAGAYSRQIPHEGADDLTKIDIRGQFISGTCRRARQIVNKDDFDCLSPGHKLEFCNFDNVSSCIRRSVWRKFPFPAVGFAEDLGWAKDVLESGEKIVFEPLSVVRHSHRRGVVYEFRRAYSHHRRAYELFSYNPVPGIGKAVVSAAGVSLRQVIGIFKAGSFSPRILFTVIMVFPRALSRALGQYKGAKDAVSSS